MCVGDGMLTDGVRMSRAVRQNSGIEIERKFLLNAFPTDLECIRVADVYQGYVSVNPEVRVHSYACNSHINYRVSIKAAGDLARREIQIYVNEEVFADTVAIIGRPLIHKSYAVYKLSNGLFLECAHVDAGLETEFMYAEVEFKSERDALNFILPEFLGKEVTYDPAYKLKNYWERTRLSL